MEPGEPNVRPQEQPGPSLPTNAPSPPPNPPSIEAAYKLKCIELKKRLQEVEANNDAMRLRNERGWRYIQKMRLESSMLLERLGLLTGMTDENATFHDIRTQAMNMMQESGAAPPAEGADDGPSERPSRRVPAEEDYLDDESVGSADDKPPTPDERPVRSKKHRKTDDILKDQNVGDNNADSVSYTLPNLMPDLAPHTPATGYFQTGPSFQLPCTPVAPTSVASSAMDVHNLPAGVAASSLHLVPESRSSSRHHLDGLTSSALEQPPCPFVSAFDHFTNRNRNKIANALYRTRGPSITDEDVHRALLEHWEDMDPEDKRKYGDLVTSKNLKN
ncbi:hypothetical protein LOZ61_003538 [Ophidiomyces ophidiicola]|uniref:Uncharacterized protein n=1 Tax=Ophidiomyces ophidiicola TaxID=1387563 RepID=A0ACB8UR62_9EURO|nr:uncharacterized protein LOZ57_002762 [Ophidiomyces ophidiicola]KAI1911997.1 hypothetical protein LOZ61_003538 [Ophidiomyces ophidiicola]KAI1925546.1 hypothetical protein LOZ60_004060 [Ophidiomyces ophidiicola]KAI1948409.1 hypothetical protein LOZ57_002762 [Ophidiomyces ophidiicola]KAI1952504.1 hypothetical protein LOZ59_005309 [Ophidiomyces ophidiicola]KAI1969535.1 hypothetical protein LOZ56_004318 [Ophidiomyces ophidiicola]